MFLRGVKGFVHFLQQPAQLQGVPVHQLPQLCCAFVASGPGLGEEQEHAAAEALVELVAGHSSPFSSALCLGVMTLHFLRLLTTTLRSPYS